MFDNPVIWILLLWWLANKFMKAKARRQRQPDEGGRKQEPAHRRMLREALLGERETARDWDKETVTRPRLEPEPAPYPGGVAEGSEGGQTSEAEGPQPATAAAQAPVGGPQGVLGQLWRDLQSELAPMREKLSEQARIQSARQAAPLPLEPPVPPSPTQKAPATAEVFRVWQPTAAARGRNLLGRPSLAQLPALQQAVVLREILGRPRALRRAIR